MATSFNLTIEDSSPLISYGPSGAWIDAPSNATNGLAYSGNSFHQTTAPGATATINFNGTGISFYGGRRPDYGVYTITVDGQTIVSTSATGPGVAAQQLLGSATGLANGPHTAVLTNTGVGMDIDWIDMQTQVGSAGSTTTSTIFDDSSPEMTYAGTWETSNTPSYLNGTIHYTQSPGAAASLPFSGNAVAVYGTVSPDHANIQISVDGKTTMVNGGQDFISELRPKTLLYYANNLDSTQHMLIVTNPGPQGGSGPFIDLDSITVYSASSMDGIGNVNGQAQSSPVANQTGSGHESSGLSKGAMIGIIAGSVLAVVAVLALIAGLLLFLRRRKRRQHPIDPKTPVDAELPLQGPNMMQFTPVSPSRPVPTFSRMSSHSIAPSYYYGTDNSSLASLASTTPMVPKVPTLSMPKMPSRSQQGVMIPSRGPGRPSRPPSLELPP